MLEDQPAAFAGPLTAVFERQTGASAGLLTEALEGLLVAPDRALPLPPASDRSVWDLGTGRADSVTMADLLRRATADLGTPWPLPLASAAARVHTDGDRVEWESAAFNRQYRLNRAVVAAAATDEKRWIDEVADGVVLLCEQSSWCWPAHDDTRRRHGAVLATVTDPYLDLGAGDVAGELAWIDHLLGAALDTHYPGLRGRIRHEARTRVLEPFVRRRDWHWIGLDGDVHNWNPWIHGNVLVAALRLLDGPDDGAERLRVISLAIEGIDRYVASLPADGAIDEGYSYWWNGACRALEALDILTHATDGALDPVGEIPALRETVAFPHRMHLGGDWYVNVADGQARPPVDQPWHALHRAARRAGDQDAEAHAAAHRRPDVPGTTEHAGLGRLLQGITDEAWLAAENSPSPLPRDVWLPSVQVIIARERGGSASGVTVAAKGGHNGEHHNHNDVGSFVVASDGVPVIVDAGRPTYTAATFGPDRYLIWTMQSSWHNVPELRESAQGAGAAFRATDVTASVADDASGLSLDLAAAYPDVGVRSWRRSVTLHRDSECARVVIDDSWGYEPDDTERTTTVRLLVAGAVESLQDGLRVTPLGDARPVRVAWDSGIRAATVVRDLDDPMLSDVWGPTLTRIELDVTARDRVVVTVEQNPDE
ncbi:heparinase II/III domain-containing protein [Microbacterium pumilum]|uniref:Heparinase II/III family protein n=1 Tax=Microbacterium pumilum TaxID=344165 RepID=A0ABP5DH93_9MICO